MTSFNTDLVHGSSKQIKDANGAINPPIYTATTYAYPDAESNVQYDYSRSGNPTRDNLQSLIAQLEHGEAGFAFASGMAAIHAVLSQFKPGDEIILGDKIYGGTYRLINEYFKRWQLKFKEVDTQDPAAVEAAITPDTKAIYFETFTNPRLQVTSVKEISAVAKKHGLLTIVDNTFLTPYLQQPLDLGADIVLHSATKYLGGHSDLIAGLVVTKTKDLAEKIYFAQNAIGGILSPQDITLLRRGIQTLAVRMDRHQENALKLAKFLQDRDEVAKVYFPGIPGTRDYEIATAEVRGYGAMISFELRDDLDAIQFVNHLQLIHIAVSLGAVESLIELPATMTHAELSPEDQLKAGITPQLLRFSVGIEDANDLIEDLAQSLDQLSK